MHRSVFCGDYSGEICHHSVVTALVVYWSLKSAVVSVLITKECSAQCTDH